MNTAKNSTHNKTYQWKAERQRLSDFYNSTPYFGNEFAPKLYALLKQVLPSVIQVSVCGVIISATTYKQDAEKAGHLLAQSFKKKIKQTECPYTGFVTTSLLNH